MLLFNLFGTELMNFYNPERHCWSNWGLHPNVDWFPRTFVTTFKLSCMAFM